MLLSIRDENNAQILIYDSMNARLNRSRGIHFTGLHTVKLQLKLDENEKCFSLPPFVCCSHNFSVYNRPTSKR